MPCRMDNFARLWHGHVDPEIWRVCASTFPMKTSESTRVLSLHEWGEVVTRKKKKITHDSS